MKALVIAAIIGAAVVANAAGPSGRAQAAGIGPSFKGPLGLQMYSLRFHTATNAMARIVSGTAPADTL
jgi:hypothetical protein